MIIQGSRQDLYNIDNNLKLFYFSQKHRLFYVIPQYMIYFCFLYSIDNNFGIKHDIKMMLFLPNCSLLLTKYLVKCVAYTYYIVTDTHYYLLPCLPYFVMKWGEEKILLSVMI